MTVETAGAILKPWIAYYNILGSAAAALTGLVFVVITLIGGDGDRPRSREGTAVFTTPTVVHFAAALLVALLLSAPWRTLVHVAIPLFASGAFGAIYIARTIVRMRRLEGYRADLEDAVWHTILPIGAYSAIAVAAIALYPFPHAAMVAFAAAGALLIFIGIHNAWDIVTFIAVREPGDPPPSSG